MKQLGELNVGELMTPNAVTIGENDRLVKAIGIMEQRRLSVLPVVDSDNRIMGILTNTDLVAMMHEIQSDLGALTWVNETTRDFLVQQLVEIGELTLVRHVMTSPVQTVSPADNLVVAARKLNDRKYHHLPVVDEAGHPVGMISSFDFIKAIAVHGAYAVG